jgi:histidinol dehydrogenase
MSFYRLKEYEWSELKTREQRNEALARPAQASDDEVRLKVAQIIAGVRSEGENALKKYTQSFDGVALDSFLTTPAEFDKARISVPPSHKLALERAKEQIEYFHAATMSQDVTVEVSSGVTCERRNRPIARVGLYIPGGTAPLPSTVLMLGVPAQLARVPLKVICTPPRRDGSIDPYILYAAELVGIDRVYKVGGAQAIAAMAYGAGPVAKVDKIFGPGNAFVTEAKMQVAQDPGGALADMPAGPSELLVIADASSNPRFVACDLLSQAEHGADSHVVLVTTSRELMDQVNEEIRLQLAGLSRRELAGKALTHAAAILTGSLTDAVEVANLYAPEHLILATANAAELKKEVMCAGSVFVGPYSSESMGDYASGTNHVLPTYGYARAVSGLAVSDFVKRITFQTISEEGLMDLGPIVTQLAMIEGLDAHARAVSVRLESLYEKESGQ